MDPETLSRWGEFGLAGMVICVLFAALFTIVKWLINHIDKQADRHESEREEWRKSQSDITLRVEKAVDEISQGIRALVVKNDSK